jgi:hypothetical protein
MGQVMSIHRKLHEANVRRIAKRIIATCNTSAAASDLAERVSHPLPGLNNWFIVKFIINRYFPQPSLCHVRYPEHVEFVVIRQLLGSTRQSSAVSGKNE